MWTLCFIKAILIDEVVNISAKELLITSFLDTITLSMGILLGVLATKVLTNLADKN